MTIGRTHSPGVNCGQQWAVSAEVDTGPGSMLQFHAHSGCHVTSRCHGKVWHFSNDCSIVMHDMVLELHLEFSIDHGRTWALIRQPCAPQCQEMNEGTVFVSDQYAHGRRVAMVLPGRARLS